MGDPVRANAEGAEGKGVKEEKKKPKVKTYPLSNQMADVLSTQWALLETNYMDVLQDCFGRIRREHGAAWEQFCSTPIKRRRFSTELDKWFASCFRISKERITICAWYFWHASEIHNRRAGHFLRDFSKAHHLRLAILADSKKPHTDRSSSLRPA